MSGSVLHASAAVDGPLTDDYMGNSSGLHCSGWIIVCEPGNATAECDRSRVSTASGHEACQVSPAGIKPLREGPVTAVCGQFATRADTSTGIHEKPLGTIPDRSRTMVPSGSEGRSRNSNRRNSISDLPMTVREAAQFLGVSPQTVYLWVERKQIPHFRVMGRNIRFLKSDLRPFRAQFKQEVENGTTA
jgi:excisionase family DNA binding protein